MIILYLLLSIFVITYEGKTLEMVHLVYRHGARSPIDFYPNDINKETDWPDGGGGRLTQIGMRMEYKLGKILKQRYMINNSFINETYVHTQVYIRSSDSDRCLQSAESQLAGFYPPSGYQIWNPEILWQPIPVHTVPKLEDTILRPDDIYCPRLKEIWQDRRESPEYKQKIVENKELFDKLTNYSGMTVSSNNIGDITDTTVCEKTQGMAVPDWINKLWNETLSLSMWFFVNRYSGDDEMGRLLGGTFLGKINDNMKQMSEGKDLKSIFKMNMFSGHDTSLLALSTSLDININVPTFSSCIMIELYLTDNGYVVEMQYRNDPYTDVLKPLKLKKCDFSCPLKDFIELTKNRTTRNVLKLCGIKGHLFPTRTLKIYVIIFASVTVLLMIVIAFYFVKRSKFGDRGNQYFVEGEHLISDHS